MADLAVTLAGEAVELLPERALHWPARRTLAVADLHWGKAETFRAFGLPLPDGSVDVDLARLVQVIQRTRAERVVVLGDLVHHRSGLTEALAQRILAFRHAAPVEFVLVRGNHDRRAPRLPDPWGIEAIEGPLLDPPFAFVHEPEPVAGSYALGGHLHPTAQLVGAGDRLRLPCFHLGPQVGVLPAFSEMTNGVKMRRRPGERRFVIAEDQVVEA